MAEYVPIDYGIGSDSKEYQPVDYGLGLGPFEQKRKEESAEADKPGLLSDVGTKLAQGVVGVQESVAGLGGLAGLDTTESGKRLAAIHERLGERLSPEQKAADEAVQKAEGFGDTIVESLKNPRSILGSVAESAPGTLVAAAPVGLLNGIFKGAATAAEASALAKGVAAPAAKIAGREAGDAAVSAYSSNLIKAGGAIEGIQTTGNIAQQAQQEGRARSDYAAPAIEAGLTTAAITALSGKLFGDVGTDLVTRGNTVKGEGLKKYAKEIATEAGEEGLQSPQEQVQTNIALGKEDIYEGAGKAAATGLLTGGAMGGGFGAKGAVASLLQSKTQTHIVEEAKPTTEEVVAEAKTKAGANVLTNLVDETGKPKGMVSGFAATAVKEGVTDVQKKAEADTVSTVTNPLREAVAGNKDVYTKDADETEVSKAIDKTWDAVKKTPVATKESIAQAVAANPVFNTPEAQAQAQATLEENFILSPEELAHRQLVAKYFSPRLSVPALGELVAKEITPENQYEQRIVNAALTKKKADLAESIANNLSAIDPATFQQSHLTRFDQAAWAAGVDTAGKSIPDVLAEIKSVVPSLRELAIKNSTFVPAEPVTETTSTQETTSDQSQNPAPQEAETKEQITPDRPIDYVISQFAATSPHNNVSTDLDPTKNQKANVDFHGLPVEIENAVGSKRFYDEGQNFNTMTTHYGGIVGTVGKDGDPVDVFIPNGLTKQDIDSSKKAYIINQVNPTEEGTPFDEHKVVLAVNSPEEALDTYKSNYTGDWQGADIESVHEVDLPTLKQWLRNGDKTVPYGEDAFEMKAAPEAPVVPTEATAEVPVVPTEATAEVPVAAPEAPVEAPAVTIPTPPLPKFLEGKGRQLLQYSSTKETIARASTVLPFTEDKLGFSGSINHALAQLGLHEDAYKQMEGKLQKGGKVAFHINPQSLLEAWADYHRLANTIELWKAQFPEKAKLIESNLEAVRALKKGDRVLIPTHQSTETDRNAPVMEEGVIVSKGTVNAKVKLSNGVEFTQRLSAMAPIPAATVPETPVAQAPVTLKVKAEPKPKPEPKAKPVKVVADASVDKESNVFKAFKKMADYQAPRSIPEEYKTRSDVSPKIAYIMDLHSFTKEEAAKFVFIQRHFLSFISNQPEEALGIHGVGANKDNPNPTHGKVQYEC